LTTWGEPRPGTEAHTVKQEVERKQKLAREKGLDKLLSNAYHDGGLQNYEAWFNSSHNKRWVHPEISEVVTGEDQADGKQVPFVEFVMAGRKYKVTSREWSGESGMYVDLTLYMNGQRVFAIAEGVDCDEYRTTYLPFGVNAYVNDAWVSDFAKLKTHHEKTLQQASNEFAEDKKRLQETKEAFGLETPKAPEITDKRDTFSQITSVTNKPTSGSKVGIWIVVAICVIFIIWWAMR
jgi:hypothetical protein